MGWVEYFGQEKEARIVDFLIYAFYSF